MFEKLNLSPELLRAVADKGYTAPTEIQEKCVPLILTGLDIVGRSKTGSGKTLAFGIPLVESITDKNFVQGIVVCPTRELAMQVAEELRSYAAYKPIAKVVSVYGGADMKRQVEGLKKARIVVATPGRLKDHIRRRSINLTECRFAVLDEADEMLDMGFREDIESILKCLPKQRQTVMFSATMPPAIKQLMRSYMREPEFIEIGAANTTLTEIAQSYIVVPPHKKKESLLNLFRTEKPKSAIVFCNTKVVTDDVYAFLSRNGVRALVLHGDIPQGTRKRVIADIKSGAVSVLVATDVAARGLDIDDIDYVINYDLPIDVESYIHRIGRTGRAGKTGNAVSLLCSKEQLNKLKYYKNVTKSDIVEHTLSQGLPEAFNLKLTKPKRRRF